MDLAIDLEMVTDLKAGYDKLMEHGWLPWMSCQPQVNTCIPKMGEYCASSESSAAAYINTILGARTNRESPINTVYAAYTGCLPKYGSHLDENRAAKCIVELDDETRDNMQGAADWAALGAAIAEKAENRIPAVLNLPKKMGPTATKQIVAVTGSLFAQALWIPTAQAQSAATESGEVAPVPISPLEQIKKKLQYLRARDAESDGKGKEGKAGEGKGGDLEGGQCPDCLYTPPAPCVDCLRATTRDPWANVKVFGAAKLDAIYNSARPQAPGAPFFLVPDFAGGFSTNTIDVNARQSLLGVLFTGPKIWDFQSGGRISAVFFDPTVLADRNGFLLQQSYGELSNDDWRFAAGLQFDVFAPGLPTMLPFSFLGGSGNVANCIRGQIRVERFVDVGSDSQLTLQGALSEPLNTYVIPDLTLDEDNSWPNVEGRIAFGLGQPAPIGKLTQRPLEVGVSGVIGQLRRTAFPTEPPRRVISDVWGVAVDFRVNLAGCFGFMGEVYTGQGLGNYNGGILQSLDAVTWRPIRATGGFVEGFVYLTPCLHSHTGIGIDDTNDDDITAIPNNLFGRTYNSTVYCNLLWDLNQSFRIGFEVTYRETKYKEPTNLPNNGFGFHTQFAWTF